MVHYSLDKQGVVRGLCHSMRSIASTNQHVLGSMVMVVRELRLSLRYPGYACYDIRATLAGKSHFYVYMPDCEHPRMHVKEY